MSTETPDPIEYELIRKTLTAEIVIDNTDFSPTSTNDLHARIEGHFAPLEDADDDDPTAGEEGDVTWAAIPFIYVIGLLSFNDATPRGLSKIDFRDQDEWHAADMLRYLRFEHGELYFYADYVRGRMMKTTVTVRRNGTFVVDTVNRGDAAGRWITTVQGKKPPAGIELN